MNTSDEEIKREGGDGFHAGGEVCSHRVNNEKLNQAGEVK